MEKPPIDDFFARKLREAEQLPSPAAFSRLQSRMASTVLPRKRRYTSLWYYGAAASLLLVTALLYHNSVKPLIGVAEQVTKRKEIGSPKPHRPIQEASQLVAKTEEEPLLGLEKGKERNKHQKLSSPALTKQVIARHETTANVIVAQKPSAQKPKIEYRIALPSSTLIDQEAIAIAPKLPPSSHNVLPSGSEAVKSTSSQRVVVLTIDASYTEAPLVALQATGVESTSQAHSGSLAGLFAKVKQLKNGDVLARVTPAKRLTEPRSRLGRVFDGMKESLKNETTLE